MKTETLIIVAFLNLNFEFRICGLKTGTCSAQNLGINSSGAIPDPSSMLDINAADKGLLIPRVTLTGTNDVTTIPGAATSLLVYNTATAGVSPDNVVPAFYYWNGTKWISLSGGSGGNDWSLTGNAGTVDGTNFLGTTDNVPLNFRVFNEKAGRIASNGPTFFGYQAGNSNTATGNTGIGYNALLSNIGGNFNTAVGYQALVNNTTGGDNTATGRGALNWNITGSRNTALGYVTLFSSTGDDNTAIGNRALQDNTTGNNNVAIGSWALNNNGTGNENIAIGRGTLQNGNHTQCTYIGSASALSTNRTNVAALGYGIADAQCTGDNQVLLGNTAISAIRAQVTGITGYSDARFKFNVKDNVKGLDFIMKLRPVTYNENPVLLHKIWGTPDSIVAKIDHNVIQKQRFIGFLAQDVEQAAKDCGFDFPGIDIPKNDREVYSMRYIDFIMPLVKSVQELKQLNDLQQKQIELLQKEIILLKSMQ